MAAKAVKRKLDNDGINEKENPTKRTDSLLRSNDKADRSTGDSASGTESVLSVSYYEQRGHWVAMYDWNSGFYYYENITNSQTQWTKPEEWDSLYPNYAPYSQHLSGSTMKEQKSASTCEGTSLDIEAKVNLFSKRPARRQIDPDESKKVNWMPEGATEYNIWYDRWVGEHWRGERDFGKHEIFT